RRRVPWGWMALGALLAVGALVAVAALVTGGGSGPAAAARVGPGTTPGGTPDFAIRTVSWSGGGEFVLSQNLGRPTVLYFMAGWCASCIPETQAWGRIKQEVGERVNVLVISPDPNETEGRMLRFKRLAGVDDGLLWAMDKGGRLTQALGVVSLDTTIVLDGEGREVYRDGVPTPYSRLRQVLEPLLGGWP
ncbi:MAG TPA: TlpA disulfide reductase family protein, partial [Dehalococcoidia bacterium]|nr:TlpA disulfide reductase family protein [Dehalococcoidia bacterium]